MTEARLPSSFRDPSGYMFRHEGAVYRHVAPAAAEDYARLVDSGLLASLVRAGLMVDHEERDPSTIPGHDAAHLLLRPEQIPFVSYPYEWSFGQLKDAALLTLEIQRRALEHGQSLKDASAYNVQFVGARPVFIDTLSFEAWSEGEPWVAYQQMCRHFLAPLALMAFTDVELHKLLRVYLDGVPLELASRLLPWRTRLRFGLLTHIHLHAGSLQRHRNTASDAASGSKLADARKAGRVGRTAMLGLVDNLRAAVSGLSWTPTGTQWAEYYDDTNYTEDAVRHKSEIVDQLVERVAPNLAFDLGANTGVFSRLVSARGVPTIAFDVDLAAVEKNYVTARERGENLLPLVLDLTNPSGDLGWDLRERESLVARGPADLALALALVHHLAIGNNVPLPMVARFFRRLCGALVIEFVPKQDTQVQRLLASRQDIFPDYTREGFEAAFSSCFALRERIEVGESARSIYLFE